MLYLYNSQLVVDLKLTPTLIKPDSDPMWFWPKSDRTPHRLVWPDRNRDIFSRSSSLMAARPWRSVLKAREISPTRRLSTRNDLMIECNRLSRTHKTTQRGHVSGSQTDVENVSLKPNFPYLRDELLAESGKDRHLRIRVWDRGDIFVFLLLSWFPRLGLSAGLTDHCVLYACMCSLGATCWIDARRGLFVSRFAFSGSIWERWGPCSVGISTTMLASRNWIGCSRSMEGWIA